MTRRTTVAISIALLLCFAGGGAYVFAARALSPKITSVRITACGLPAKTPGFGVPLRALMAAAPNVPIRFGPVKISGIEEPIHLEFDPALKGAGGRAVNLAGTLRLPVTDGSGRYPDRIMLVCREARVASVYYKLELGGRMALEVIDATPDGP